MTKTPDNKDRIKLTPVIEDDHEAVPTIYKRCAKCWVMKSVALFNKDISAGDGLYSYCQECHRALVKAYYASSEGKEAHLKSGRKWEQENRDKKIAHQAVKRAMGKGTLTRFPCLVCGATEVNAHHRDYQRKLDVDWLCDRHHADLHAGRISLEDELHDCKIETDGHCDHTTHNQI